MIKKLIRKMLIASGGPIQKQKHKYLDEALKFAEDYRNSPGFKERWSRIGKVPGTYRIKNSKYNPLLESEYKLLWKIGPFKKGNYIPWKEDPKNSKYKYGNGDFYIGTSKKPGYAFSNWKDVLTHEAGHYLEESLNNPTLIYKDLYTINSPLNFYSEIYPVFRKSNSYKNMLDFISDDKEDMSEYNKNPVTKSWSFNYDWGTNDTLHDASPSESYADLFLLRKKLLDSRIYDVRKANNPFTKEHLKIFKKKNKDKIRLFDNFSDDDIIWMMNNVAENNKNLNILYNYYAKQGGKMNIIDFLKKGSGIYIKKENRGKFTSYCGGKVTDECILKGKNSSNPAIRKRATFAANARKWKHKEGGKAFVSGVSILDSNPDAYKYVKKKLKKHLEGGKTSTWLKIGNFLNNDTGKGVISLGTQLFGTVSGAKKASDFSNDYDEATKTNVKAMTELQKAKNKKLAGLYATLYISLLLLQNPDNHYGELDLLQLTLKIADSLYDPLEIIDYLNLRYSEKLKLMLAILGSAGNSINWIDSIGGIASNFLNKSSNNSNLSSTVTPKLTTNTWKPSTSLSTPSLGTGAQGSIPDFSYMLNPSYKV